MTQSSDTTMNSARSCGTKVGEVRLNKLALNLLSIPLTAICCAPTVALALFLNPNPTLTLGAAIMCLAGLILLTIVHEALHMSALLLTARLPLSAFRFGVLWSSLIPYCHCKAPLSQREYRYFALAPLVVTGTGMFVVLLVVPGLVSGFLAGFAIASCLGDVWLLAKARKLSDSVLLRDHESEIGFDVYEPVS